MKTIYKYVLYGGVTKALIPHGAKVLSVQLQNDKICVWMEVNTDNEPEERTFFIVGTGTDLLECMTKFIGTVQQDSFVWHVYE